MRLASAVVNDRQLNERTAQKRKRARSAGRTTVRMRTKGNLLAASGGKPGACPKEHVPQDACQATPFASATALQGCHAISISGRERPTAERTDCAEAEESSQRREDYRSHADKRKPASSVRRQTGRMP